MKVFPSGVGSQLGVITKKGNNGGNPNSWNMGNRRGLGGKRVWRKGKSNKGMLIGKAN